MKRLLIILACVMLAAPAGADLITAGNWISLNLNTGVLGGTANTILYVDGTTTLGSSSSLAYNDSGSGNGTFTFLKTMSGTSETSNFFNLTATMPTTLATGAIQSAVYSNVTSAGTSSITNGAARIAFNVGYTGTKSTYGLFVSNVAAGTGTSCLLTGSTPDTPSCNFGVYAGMSTASSGHTAALYGSAGVGLLNYGVLGSAQQNRASAANVGVAGFAFNANGTGPIYIGGYFSTSAAVPTYGTSAALMADNADKAVDIIASRDNGTIVGVVQDGGSTWEKIGTKALTLGGGAVAFVQIAVTSNSYQGGLINWCADATDTTNYQTRCGVLPFSIVNVGGTETCTVGTPTTATESVAASSGTFTVAFTTDTSPTNACNILANGTSSLTETVMRINYHVRLFGNAATAVTAQ